MNRVPTCATGPSPRRGVERRGAHPRAVVGRAKWHRFVLEPVECCPAVRMHRLEDQPVPPSVDAAASGNYALRRGNYTLRRGKYNLTRGNYTLRRGKYNLDRGNYTLNQGKYNLSRRNYTLNREKYNLRRRNDTLNRGKYNLRRRNYTLNRGKYTFLPASFAFLWGGEEFNRTGRRAGGKTPRLSAEQFCGGGRDKT